MQIEAQQLKFVFEDYCMIQMCLAYTCHGAACLCLGCCSVMA